jgi:hypothetical protein
MRMDRNRLLASHREILADCARSIRFHYSFMPRELLDEYCRRYAVYLRTPEGAPVFIRYIRGHRRAVRLVCNLDARLTGLDRRNWYEIQQA